MLNKVKAGQKLLFLETTIQIDRVIGRDERRETIKRSTQGQRLCTSGHVLAEYNRTLIKDAATFRNLLLTSPDVGEAVKRFGKYPQNRKFPRLVFLLASLGFDNDRQTVLERLQDFIEFRGHHKFWQPIDRSLSIDEVKCPHRAWQAQQGETENYDVDSLKCLKDSPPPCGVADFIERNRAILESFVSNAQRHSRANVARAAKAFAAILSGSDVPFGERSCYRLADTCIVLEAPSDAEIYSTDQDIHIICDILGKSAYVEIPTGA